MFFLQSLFYLIFEPIRLNKSRLFIFTMFCWFIYSQYGLFFDIWHLPRILTTWLFSVINPLSMIWLAMVYYNNLHSRYFRLILTGVFAWYCSYIYWDVAVYSYTISEKILIASVDTSMILLLATFNIIIAFAHSNNETILSENDIKNLFVNKTIKME